MQRKDTPGNALECGVGSVSELIAYDSKFVGALTGDSFTFLTDFQTTASVQRAGSSESYQFVDYNLKNVPTNFCMSLESAFGSLNSIVEIPKLTVSKVSAKLSLKVGQVYKCDACGQRFPAWADVLQHNRISAPTSCFPLKSELPQSKAVGSSHIAAKCESSEFTAMEGGEIYTDYIEVKLCDGANCVKGVILGATVNDVSKGDEVTVIGAIGLRWLRDPSFGIPCESEFLLKVASLRKAPKLTIHRGLTNFAKFLETLHPFQRRSVIVRSSFTRVYQEYDLKLAGLLVLICHFSSSKCNLLVAGPRGTGKSLFLRSLTAFSRGQSTTLLSCDSSSGRILVIDNFHTIKDRRKLIPIMESASVVAALTSFHGGEGADKETAKSKKLYQAGLTRCSPLCADLDRFDLIVYQPFGHEDDIEYVSKVLRDEQMEELDQTWDSDTIFEYLQSVACPLADVPMESRLVENLIHEFVASIVRSNMSQTQSQGGSYVSARLVESLIKLSRAHAVLLGHRIVTKFDVVSCVMLMLQLKGAQAASEFLDEDAFMEKLEEVNRVYTGMAKL